MTVMEGGEGGGSDLVMPASSSVLSWHCCRFRNRPRLNFVVNALKDKSDYKR